VSEDIQFKYIPPIQDFFDLLPIFHPYTLDREESKKIERMVGWAIVEIQKGVDV